MELILKNEAYIFLGMFLSGLVLGFMCDLTGISSHTQNSNVIFIGIKDILFCTFMSVVFFIIIYILNNGEIRWYEITGSVLGFIIYVLTVKKYVLRFLDTCKKLIKRTLLIISKPILKVFKLFNVPYTKLKNILKKTKKLFKTVKYKQNLKIRQIKYIFKKI